MISAPNVALLLLAAAVGWTSTAAVVTTIEAPPPPSSSAHVTIKTCRSTNCSTNCTSYSFPTGQCQYGAIYTCGPSLAQCIDLTNYNATSTNDDACNASHYFGTGSAVCDFCYAIRKSDNNSQFVHGVVRGCSSDATRAFHHECDDRCENCGKVTPLPLNTCTKDPLTNNTLVATRVHSCNELVFLNMFENDNCTGAMTTSTVIMADSCLQDSLHSSTDFMCSLH